MSPAPSRDLTRRAALAGVLALGATTLAACASGDPTSSAPAASSGGASSASGGSGPIVIGSADFSESQLLALIYSHALQGAGVAVQEKLNIGSREVYLQALKDGSIDLMPEYSGYLLTALVPSEKEGDPQVVLTKLATALPAGLEILDASTAEDKDELVVTQDFATKNGVTTISGLAPFASQMVLAGPAEWKERYTGVPGLKAVYGLTFKDFKVLDAGGPLTLAALVNGQAQAGNMFSTDPAIKANGLVALTDDKHLFLPAEVVPVIRTSKATAQAKAALNAVQAKLTTSGLMDMNAKANNGGDLSGIAQDWLKAQGIASA